LRAVLPPDETVAEERAKAGWACKGLLDRHTTPLRSIKLLKRMLIFIKPGGANDRGSCARRRRVTVGGGPNQVGNVSKLTANSGIALKGQSEGDEGSIDRISIAYL
jgi:hypothetical protein